MKDFFFSEFVQSRLGSVSLKGELHRMDESNSIIEGERWRWYCQSNHPRHRSRMNSMIAGLGCKPYGLKHDQLLDAVLLNEGRLEVSQLCV